MAANPHQARFGLIPIRSNNQHANLAYQLDAQVLALQLRRADVMIDLAYLDPPYNQHPYGSNYHVLNTVTLWDKPPLNPHITGRDKSAIRTDWRTKRRSAYNHATAANAFATLLETINAHYILTSYSTDGNIPLRELLKTAAQRGTVECVTNSYKRYRVSSQRMSAKPVNAEFVLIINRPYRD